MLNGGHGVMVGRRPALFSLADDHHLLPHVKSAPMPH